MLDGRVMRPTPGYLAHIPPIYIILVAAAHSFAVESTVTMPLCYQLHMLCGGRVKITIAIAVVKHQSLLTMASRR